VVILFEVLTGPRNPVEFFFRYASSQNARHHKNVVALPNLSSYTVTPLKKFQGKNELPSPLGFTFPGVLICSAQGLALPRDIVSRSERHE
jgi:hypothetical protein